MSSLRDRLRHRVRIESLTVSRDGFGGAIERWQVLHDRIPAEVVPLSGREFMAAQAVQNAVTARIVIRHVPGLAADMRVLHDERAYNIIAVLPDPTGRRHLTLMCEEVTHHD